MLSRITTGTGLLALILLGSGGCSASDETSSAGLEHAAARASALSVDEDTSLANLYSCIDCGGTPDAPEPRTVYISRVVPPASDLAPNVEPKPVASVAFLLDCDAERRAALDALGFGIIADLPIPLSPIYRADLEDHLGGAPLIRVKCGDSASPIAQVYRNIDAKEGTGAYYALLRDNPNKLFALGCMNLLSLWESWPTQSWTQLARWPELATSKYWTLQSTAVAINDATIAAWGGAGAVGAIRCGENDVESFPSSPPSRPAVLKDVARGPQIGKPDRTEIYYNRASQELSIVGFRGQRAEGFRVDTTDCGSGDLIRYLRALRLDRAPWHNVADASDPVLAASGIKEHPVLSCRASKSSVAIIESVYAMSPSRYYQMPGRDDALVRFVGCPDVDTFYTAATSTPVSRIPMEALVEQAAFRADRESTTFYTLGCGGTTAVPPPVSEESAVCRLAKKYKKDDARAATTCFMRPDPRACVAFVGHQTFRGAASSCESPLTGLFEELCQGVATLPEKVVIHCAGVERSWQTLLDTRTLALSESPTWGDL